MLAVVVVMVAVGVVAVLSHLGGVLADRAAARTAADAAALAAAVEGRTAAEEAAVRNGGVMEDIEFEGPEAEVTVRVGRARAVARARPETAIEQIGGFP